MDRIEIPKLTNSEVGTKNIGWFRFVRIGHPMLQCKCGERAFMTLHEIAEDGTVNPSILCPANCGWHVWGRLIGWDGGPLQSETE